MCWRMPEALTTRRCHSFGACRCMRSEPKERMASLAPLPSGSDRIPSIPLRSGGMPLSHRVKLTYGQTQAVRAIRPSSAPPPSAPHLPWGPPPPSRFMREEGFSESEANQKWLEDLANPQVRREKKNGVMKLAVSGHDAFVSEQGTSKEQRMSKQTALEATEEKRSAAKRARRTHDMSDAHFADFGGDHFRDGASAVAGASMTSAASTMTTTSSLAIPSVLWLQGWVGPLVRGSRNGPVPSPVAVAVVSLLRLPLGVPEICRHTSCAQWGQHHRQEVLVQGNVLGPRSGWQHATIVWGWATACEFL